MDGDRAPSNPACPVPMDGDLLEIRIAGRGGQGVVTAGELAGSAVLSEGRHAQVLPTFGPERRGALATSTLRVSDRSIHRKYAAARPGVVAVLDPTIWRHANVALGVREGALLLFNTTREPGQVRRKARVAT